MDAPTVEAPPAPTIDAGKLIENYIKVRDARDEVVARHKKELERYEEALQKLSEKLEAVMDSSNTKSLKADAGTASITVRSVARCGDWASFYKYVAENERFDLLPKKVNTGPVKEIIEETSAPPPGVQLENTRTIMVRRATKKSK